MKLISFSISLILLTATISVKAQVKKVLADKIVATVGDKFILKSDVENAISDYKRQAQGQENVEIPTECKMIEGQLIRKALVLQALKDSINVTDDEVEVAMESRIRNFIQQFGSKEVLEEVAGRTV